MKTLSTLFTVPLVLFALVADQAERGADTDSGAPQNHLRAKHVITVADDFVVDVYHNGVKVPDAKRRLLVERFGATAEKIDIQVRKGDWLVFNVVNNRLRWGGCYYFGVAGCVGGDEYGFVSDPKSPAWSVCDDPAQVDRFIKERPYLSYNRAARVERPWGEGKKFMQACAGKAWHGEPLWGRTRNTWVKVRVY